MNQLKPDDAMDNQSPLADASDEAIDLSNDDAAVSDVPAEYELQIAELKDQLIRALAENENIRKRAQRDLEESNKYAITGFARQMISVLENLQRATSSISEDMRAENEQVKNLALGVEMTLRELLTAFERFGITRIEPIGEKFDHNLHQAVIQIDDPVAEPGTVLQVLQAGYTIHDRLLQPAMVGVAKRGETPNQVDTQA